jgi:hypothetical protein
MAHEISYQFPNLFIIFWIILVTFNIFILVKKNKIVIKTFIFITGLTLLSLVFLFGEIKRNAIVNEVANGRLNVLHGKISKYKPYNDLVDIYIDEIKIKASFGSQYCGLPKYDYMVGDELKIKYIKLNDYEWINPEFCILEVQHIKIANRKRLKRTRYNNTLKNGRSETAPL